MGYNSFGAREFARKSLRLPSGDYTKARAYFVTTCTGHREPLFDIPELYKIASDTWNRMSQRFPIVPFDEFVFMPDHVHFIIWLNKTQQGKELTVGQVVGAYKSLVAITWLNHIKENDLNLLERYGNEASTIILFVLTNWNKNGNTSATIH